MGVDLWKVEHKLVRRNLTEEEQDFIRDTFAECDDGTLGVNESILNDAIKSCQEGKVKVSEELVTAIREKVKGLSKGMLLSLAVF